MFISKKTFPPISVAFRNWKADHSHCSLIHGYGIIPTVVFMSPTVDDRGWVMDYGGFKELRNRFEAAFDHKMVVAKDDPQRELFQQMHDAKVAEIVLIDRVSTENFASVMKGMTLEWMVEQNIRPEVSLQKVIVEEHHLNSAEVVCTPIDTFAYHAARKARDQEVENESKADS
jgi:6-pyruvoyltetrahydropterin/6-carboxytetrahydropterin synthase